MTQDEEDERIETIHEIRELYDQLSPFDKWHILWIVRWKLARNKIRLFPAWNVRWMLKIRS